MSNRRAYNQSLGYIQPKTYKKSTSKRLYCNFYFIFISIITLTLVVLILFYEHIVKLHEDTKANNSVDFKISNFFPLHVKEDNVIQSSNIVERNDNKDPDDKLLIDQQPSDVTDMEIVNSAISYEDIKEENIKTSSIDVKNHENKNQLEYTKTILPATTTTTRNKNKNKQKNRNNIPLQNTSKKKKRPKDPYNYVVNIQPEWGYPKLWPEKYIEIMPTNKIMLKKDRRVVFPNLVMKNYTRGLDTTYYDSSLNEMMNTGTIISNKISNENNNVMISIPKELTRANMILQRHPIYNSNIFNIHKHTLEEVMGYIKNSSVCNLKPVYITLATVQSDLYWQLIENFIYTLVKFGQSHCALVICVSDENCMEMCRNANFPCYNYVSDSNPLPSVMEQIAQVKLYHIPKVLNQGVDVFMLDLDVGFLENPGYMVEAFYGTPIVDIMVQEDYIFIMNRTKESWGKYFTEPLPNIGLFLCRGNNRTARVFELAWEKYLKMSDPIEKSQPGKDQMHVLDGMRIGRGTFGLKYAYFTHDTAPLLDKLVLQIGHTVELGGEAIGDLLFKKKSIAMHSTCYEKSTKVMGLKASNAFWNPKYYNPSRRTITKQILYVNELQLLDEVRSLVWLALVTERSLIIPNILASSSLHNKYKYNLYNDQLLWPGFRVLYLKTTNGQNDLSVEVLEPAFYWRTTRDYDDIPEPYIIYFNPSDDLQAIREKLDINTKETRIIIHHDKYSFSNSALSSSKQAMLRQESERNIYYWANNSVGIYKENYDSYIKEYQSIPSVKQIRNLQGIKGIELIENLIKSMRNCNGILGPLPGSRNCFKICQ